VKSTVRSLKTDLIVIDQTHPVLDFPTVRVIMPGISDVLRYWDPDKLTKEMLADTSKEDKTKDRLVIEVIKSFYKERKHGQNNESKTLVQEGGSA